jgi:hypothetical protein
VRASSVRPLPFEKLFERFESLFEFTGLDAFECKRQHSDDGSRTARRIHERFCVRQQFLGLPQNVGCSAQLRRFLRCLDFGLCAFISFCAATVLTTQLPCGYALATADRVVIETQVATAQRWHSAGLAASR